MGERKTIMQIVGRFSADSIYSIYVYSLYRYSMTKENSEYKAVYGCRSGLKDFLRKLYLSLPVWWYGDGDGLKTRFLFFRFYLPRLSMTPLPTLDFIYVLRLRSSDNYNIVQLCSYFAMWQGKWLRKHTFVGQVRQTDLLAVGCGLQRLALCPPASR